MGIFASIGRCARCALLGVVTLPVMLGCHAKRAIVIEREQLLDGVEMHAIALTRSGDGGFIVLGTNTTGRAVATDRRGRVLWQYVDPLDDSFKTRSPALSQSVFYGAVPLTGGNLLLYGSRETKEGKTVAELTTLDAAGRLVDRRVVLPGGDDSFAESSFTRRFGSSAGIILSGPASHGLGSGGNLWVVQLDQNGSLQAQTMVQVTAPVTPSPPGEPTFVMSVFADLSAFNVIRFDLRGRIVAKSKIPAEFLIQLGSVKPTARSTFLSYETGKPPWRHELDERLREDTPPRELADFVAVDGCRALNGCGFVLSDDSLALFGRKDKAAVAWVSASGRSASIRELDTRFESFAVQDVVYLSADRFVTVRDSVGPDPNARGIVLSWIDFK